MSVESNVPELSSPSASCARTQPQGARRFSPSAYFGIGIAALLGLIAFVLGASDRVNPIDPRLVESVVTCAGTIATEKGVKIDTTALRERMSEKSGASLSASARLDVVIRTELLEKLAEGDRLEGLKLYQACMKEREHSSPPALLDAISKSQDVWNLYDAEVIRTHGQLPPSKADEAIAVGRQLEALDDMKLSLKEKIVKYDREALMYLIATEILVTAADSASLRKASQTSLEGVKLARQGRAFLKKGLDTPTPEFTTWAKEKKMDTTTAERLLETLAQAHYMRPSTELENEVKSVLDDLPCDYVVTRKLREEMPIKRYTPKLERLRECNKSVLRP